MPKERSSARQPALSKYRIVIAMILIAVMVFVPLMEVDAAKSGWIYKGKKKVSFRTKSGKLATGAVKIGGKTYVFTTKGKLRTGKKERLLKSGSNWYSVRSDGTARKGWQTYGKRLYYFRKTDGAMAKNRVVGGIRLQSNGKAYMSLDASLKYLCIRDIKKVSSLDAKKSEQRRAVWNYLSSRAFRYSTTTYPKKGDERWPKTVAYKFLTQKHGNCYGFACAFAAYTETIGYNPYVVAGRCPGGRDGAADGYTRHSVVKIGGKWYDPEANRVGWARGIYKRDYLSFSFKQRKYTRYKTIDGSIRTSLVNSVKGRKSYVFKEKGYYGFDADGRKLKGFHVISGKMFNFTHKGAHGYYMTKTEYARLKAASKKGSDFEELKKIVGNPSSYDNGCDIRDGSYDRTYKYPNTLVICRVHDDGRVLVDAIHEK